jgi:phage/plasmid-like protein (TIGR03299 family)
MAHLLNQSANGTWSFASNSEKAWHGLGQVVEGAMTSEEAIKLANLDYEVDKTKVFFNCGNPECYNEIDGYFATYRKDTNDYLGMVKSRYEVVQNRDAFGFFDAIIDQGEAIFETAGVLGKGERIFVTAKLPDDFEIKGEKIEKYIVLTNSHDGTSSVIAGLTNIRIVCNNTLQAALNGLENKVSIKHTSGVQDRLKEAHRVMGIASKYSKEVESYFTKMSDFKMDEGQTIDFITKIMTPEYLQVPKDKEEEKQMSTRLKNIIDSTVEFTLTHPTQTTDALKGNLWGVYNGVSGYYNYVKQYNNTEDKFKSQFFGAGNTKILKAFNEANRLIFS